MVELQPLHQQSPRDDSSALSSPAASQSLITEAQKNHAATASAIEKLQAQTAANQKFVSQVGGLAQRIERRVEERVEKTVEQVAGEASATMTANFEPSNDRAERIIAAAAKLETRQLWTTAAAMCLTAEEHRLLAAADTGNESRMDESRAELNKLYQQHIYV